jgi:K+-sensing histidine kinase KdpD
MADNRDRSRQRLVLWLGLFVAIVGPVLLTVALNLAGGPRLRDYAFLYVGLVALIGVAFGLRPSLAAAVVSFGLVDWFFVPPYYTFTIASEQDVVNLLVLVGAAGLVGGLGSVRRQAQLRSDSLSVKLQMANKELERLNREQADAAQVALRLAITEEQVKALEESDRARRDFLANVSHDLRTPISTILTETTAVVDDPTISAEARSSLESVTAEALRLNAIVADMLDMARIEGNSLDLNIEPVDLSRAIRSAAERLRRVSPDRPVSVTEPTSTFVLADWARLGQVLDNLLSNADRAAPPLSKIDVQVEAAREQGAATVRVRDDGPGLPQELGDRVFERFVRGESSGGGTGLGLAIVKGLVEAHAGRVWIDSGPPGATIAFSIPLAGIVNDRADGRS